MIILITSHNLAYTIIMFPLPGFNPYFMHVVAYVPFPPDVCLIIVLTVNSNDAVLLT